MSASALSSITSLHSDDDDDPEEGIRNPPKHPPKPTYRISTVVNARVLARRATKSFRFRSLWRWAIRKVIRMIHATNAITINRTFLVRGVDAVSGSNQDLEFNMDKFKAASKKVGGSDKISEALMKLPEDRGEDDFKALEVMMRNLPGFSSYSKEAKRTLGKVIGYSKFGVGRTILKQ
ncbi:UNVERIFIED_CONTAM: hypothetical protein HDU68_004410, partial [Siphonaria sp. JEL0065]